jgi:hypothetical protein
MVHFDFLKVIIVILSRILHVHILYNEALEYKLCFHFTANYFRGD